MGSKLVLLDECVPRPLRRLIPEHDVRTVYFMGWDQLSNGDLIARADAEGFDVLLTADRNLSYQQNMEGRNIALVVLPTNRWADLTAHITTIITVIDRAEPSSFQDIAFD